MRLGKTKKLCGKTTKITIPTFMAIKIELKIEY